ncbi:hypothetical protein Tco_0169832, partial [Tanacetum coccineum]
MSDSKDSTVTYTKVSSPFEDLSDIGSPGVDGLPMMPEDPYAYVVAAFRPHHHQIISWSSWTALARSAAVRTGRLLDGRFAFFIAKNGIGNRLGRLEHGLTEFYGVEGRFFLCFHIYKKAEMYLPNHALLLILLLLDLLPCHTCDDLARVDRWSGSWMLEWELDAGA